MSLGTTISKTEAQARIETWQTLNKNQLAPAFTNQSSRMLAYELSGAPLDAMMEHWDQTEEPRFRMHAAVGEAGSFEVLLELISGTSVTELQSDALYVPALTSAGIAVPDPEPPTPPREIAPSEAKMMADEWQNTAADEIAGTVTGSEGRLRYITYEQEKSNALKAKLEAFSDPTLLVFLAVKTSSLQAKYEDDSNMLFTFVCGVPFQSTGQRVLRAGSNQENSYFEWGSFCPPFCQ